MRRAFTLIELLTVIGIMALLGGLAAPAMLKAGQRASIGTACSQVQQAWMQARALAMRGRPMRSEDLNGNGTLDDGEDLTGNGTLDATTKPWHSGIVLVQPADGGAAWVGLIFDNRTSAAIAADPDGSLLVRATGKPVLRQTLPAGMTWAVAAAYGGTPTACAAGTAYVIYAQYGSGAPISSNADLANATTAGLVSIGTKTSPASGYPGELRLLAGTTPVATISIHEAGICVAQDL